MSVVRAAQKPQPQRGRNGRKCMVSAAQIGGLASEHFAPPGLGAFF